MPANFLTLPAHSISTDIEKHDGMLVIIFVFCMNFLPVDLPGGRGGPGGVEG